MANQHGHTDIIRDGQIFICRPQGGFNLEGAKEHEQAFAAEVEQVQDRPWAVLELIMDFGSGNDEVMTRFANQFTWCAQHNCCGLAIVNKSSLMSSIIEKFFVDVPLEIKWCDSEKEAMAWLKEQLHQTDIALEYALMG